MVSSWSSMALFSLFPENKNVYSSAGFIDSSLVRYIFPQVLKIVLHVLNIVPQVLNIVPHVYI